MAAAITWQPVVNNQWPCDVLLASWFPSLSGDANGTAWDPLQQSHADRLQAKTEAIAEAFMLNRQIKEYKVFFIQFAVFFIYLIKVEQPL